MFQNNSRFSINKGLVISCVAALTACGSDVYQGAELAKVGTQYSLSTTASSSTIAYRVSGGGEAVESSSLVEVAADCATASGVLTKRTETAEEETLQLLQIIAHTNLNHPLIPDEEDVFAEREAMIFQERTRTARNTYVEETLIDAASPAPLTTNTYNDEAQETSSSYFGVTADEYVVRFEMGSLWSDFEAVDPSTVELWTRNNPSVGDVWVSQNGNTVYIYAGIDVLNLGSVPTEVHKVEMYEVGGLQAEGSDVYNQCLSLGRDQVQSTDPNQTQQDLEGVFLDAGCIGGFTHVKTGTQWWYKNLLLQEEGTTQEIDILDYGFEWYEADPLAGTCSRQTGFVYGDPLVPASPFVEYTLTTRTYKTELADWTEPQ